MKFQAFSIKFPDVLWSSQFVLWNSPYVLWNLLYVLWSSWYVLWSFHFFYTWLRFCNYTLPQGASFQKLIGSNSLGNIISHWDFFQIYQSLSSISKSFSPDPWGFQLVPWGFQIEVYKKKSLQSPLMRQGHP